MLRKKGGGGEEGGGTWANNANNNSRGGGWGTPKNTLKSGMYGALSTRNIGFYASIIEFYTYSITNERMFPSCSSC